MKIGIVTGASSGLGREFVRQIAASMPELEEIWVIARREKPLGALRRELGNRIRPLPLDLTQEESIARLEALLCAEQPDVALLVNAAGTGRIGNSAQLPRRALDEMINLNCRAAVDVTAAALPYMKRKAAILMICSVAAFQPLPYLNVYAASKAFLYRYARALSVELFGRGIRVTAVCPYWVKDTEFIAIAAASDTQRAIRHYPLASRCTRVVRRALADSRLGLPVSTPGPLCLLHRLAAKILPADVMMALWALMRRL